GIAVFIVLPLGLLKNVNSLNSICTAAVIFYACLVFKIFIEAFDKIFSSVWLSELYFWRPSGLLQCLPIFSMSLFCQTQLFDIFESISHESLDKLNSIVRSSMNMCTCVYISVGILGYIAYHDQSSLSGNILTSFSQCLSSDVIKIGFIMSIAVSFPLVIFPCRSSIYSLLSSKEYVLVSGGRQHIAETPFKCITFFIVTFSLVTGLLMPNIEVVLGLIGSTIGVIINVMFPSMFLVRVANKNPKEKFWAKFIILVGVFIMVMGTMANLFAIQQSLELSKTIEQEVISTKHIVSANNVHNEHLQKKIEEKPLKKNKVKAKKESKEIPNIKIEAKPSEEIRVEPPIPVEPVDAVKPIVKTINSKIETANSISKDAIKKEEEELEKRPEIDILEKLKSHENEGKKILAESKQILNELKETRLKLEKNNDELKLINKLNTTELKLKNMNIMLQNENDKKIKLEEVIKDKIPIPLALHENNSTKSKNTNTELIREKRYTKVIKKSLNDEVENCKKEEKAQEKKLKSQEQNNNIEEINVQEIKFEN
ncbi:putative sodium-coupled neutral amino acid transporter 10, partial [Daktulosphaira vitifoliae]|uniref:putative sodium-coupled neutral amino acid transporter 10 n=1 Tax=Daktulosphaira vitifoliae TaxID=58002 RepID=UPI0021AA5751